MDVVSLTFPVSLCFVLVLTDFSEADFTLGCPAVSPRDGALCCTEPSLDTSAAGVAGPTTVAAATGESLTCGAGLSALALAPGVLHRT